MPVSRQEIEHLAELSRLNLSTEEINRLSRELGDILNYVSKVQAVVVGAKAIKTKSQPDNNLRLDAVERFSDTDQLVRQAPRSKKNLISVPPVFGD